jgi:hypothetical protein
MRTDNAISLDVASAMLATRSRIFRNVLKALAQGGLWSSERLADAVYADNADPPLHAAKCIKVIIGRCRHELPPHGLTIASRRGQSGGYELTRVTIPARMAA